jgi:hypothetical protein
MITPRMFTATSERATKNPTRPIPKEVVGLWHASGLIVAVRAVVVPEGQVLQLVEPIISLYVPIAQALQMLLPSVEEKYPAGQGEL